jgi:hypothetical protein
LRLRLEALEDRVVPATVTWVNPAGGDWDVPMNWSSGMVPLPGADAVIDIPGITVTHANPIDDTVNSLICKDTLVVSNGSLTVSTGSSVNTLTVTGGTMIAPASLTVPSALMLNGAGALTGSNSPAGPGNLAIDGLFTWSAGTLSGFSMAHANGGITLEEPGPDILNNCVLQSVGAATIMGQASVTLVNNAHWNVQSGMAGAPGAASVPLSTLTNLGTLGGGKGPFTFQGNLVNQGMVDGGSVSSGFLGDITNMGTFTGSASATLTGKITNAGTFTMGTLTSTVTGDITNQPGALFTGTGASSIVGNILNQGTFIGSGSTLAAGNIVNEGSFKPGPGAGSIKHFPTGTKLNLTQTGTTVSSGRQASSVPVLIFDIGGPMPGIDYDQIEVNGSIQLAGDLRPQQPAGSRFLPALGEQFTIIKNDAGMPITGQFAGLPEGATITVPALDQSSNPHPVMYQITYMGNNEHDVVLTNLTPLTGVQVAQLQVTTAEGKTATNSGSWSDVQSGDTVIVTASVGTINQPNTTGGSGAWSWSFPTTDGPSQSQTVTITATDQQNPQDSSKTTFNLVVNSVPPTATILGAPTTIVEETPITVTAQVSEASPEDAQGGFTYSWHLLHNNTVIAQGSAPTFTFAPDEGTYVVRLRVTDSDGAIGVASPQTIVVTEEPGPVVAGPAQPAAPLAGDADAASRVLNTTPSTLIKASGFKGVGLQDEYNQGSGFIPADPMGAAGPNQFVEMINGQFAVYTKAGVLVSQQSLDAFWSSQNPAGDTTDPRILYDRRSGRWFASSIDLNDGIRNNDLLVAVSKTSDPTGGWNQYKFLAGSSTEFADYDTLGVDDNGAYLGVTMLSTTSAAPHAAIFAIPKTPLLSGSAVTPTKFDNITDMESSPQPAYNLDAVAASGPAWFVSSSTTSFGNVEYKTLTWSGTTPTLSATREVSTPAYAPVMNAPSSGGTLSVDTGDDRLQMAVILNGQLWTARTVGVNHLGTDVAADRDGAEFLELMLNITPAADTLTLTQSGRAFDTAMTVPHFYYFPSVMVNSQGYMAMGFSGSSATQFIGAYATARNAFDPLGQLQPVSLLKAGEGAYTIDFGSGINRWGGYSYTSLDPSDSKTLWTIQEYAAAPGTVVHGSVSRWGTWIQELQAPQLATTVVTSSPNPSFFGQVVSFTAAVSASGGTGTPTGTVTFREGTVVLANRALVSGRATFTTNTLAVGSHTITVVYSGDSQFASGIGNDAGHPQVVNKDGSKTTLISAPDPSVFGQLVSFTATVTSLPPGSGSPMGTVLFMEGTATIGATTLVSGAATFATRMLAVGGHVITAAYLGDGHFAGSKGSDAAHPQMVHKDGTATTVGSSLNPSVQGHAVTFTAIVTALAPGSGLATGMVTFKDGAAVLGTGTLVGGKATFSTAALTVGTHTITAVYSGDSHFLPSTAPAIRQVVQAMLIASPASLPAAGFSLASTPLPARTEAVNSDASSSLSSVANSALHGSGAQGLAGLHQASVDRLFSSLALRRSSGEAMSPRQLPATTDDWVGRLF